MWNDQGALITRVLLHLEDKRIGLDYFDFALTHISCFSDTQNHAICRFVWDNRHRHLWEYEPTVLVCLGRRTTHK